MKTFFLLREEAEKHIVMAFGRLNPPTTGHAKLVDKLHSTAKSLKADHQLVMSHSQDSKKNPLTAEQKLKHAQRFFPNTKISTASKEMPSLMHHASAFHKAGYQHLTMIAGSDRVDEYKKLLHNYNGKFDKNGNGYHFKSINVVSAGHRDPDAEGAEGMSASKMREHVKNNNFQEFKKGVPSHVSDAHARELFDDVRHGMKLHEQLDRELYKTGRLFHVGDAVEDLVSEQEGVIEFRGTNYVTVKIGEKINKRWLDEVVSLVEPHEQEKLKTFGESMSNVNPDGTRKAFKDIRPSLVKKDDPSKPIEFTGEKKDPYGRSSRKKYHQFYQGLNKGGSANEETVLENEYTHGTMDNPGKLVNSYKHPNGDTAAVYKQRFGGHFSVISHAAKNGSRASSARHDHDDNYDKIHSDLKAKGFKPRNEEVEIDDDQIDESLIAAARAIADKDSTPEYKAAASCMLQGSCKKLKAHLDGPGRKVKVKILQALHNHGGSEGHEWAKKLGYLGEEFINEGHIIVRQEEHGGRWTLDSIHKDEHEAKKWLKSFHKSGVNARHLQLHPDDIVRIRDRPNESQGLIKNKIADHEWAENRKNEQTELKEMDDVTSVAKRIGIGNLDPTPGKKKTMADGKKKKKKFLSLSAAMKRAHELAIKGMNSVKEEDIKEDGHQEVPMVHLVNIYRKGHHVVRLWQNHVGGYDYNVVHQDHSTGNYRTERHQKSYDEIHAHLKGQGFKAQYESAQPAGTIIEQDEPKYQLYEVGEEGNLVEVCIPVDNCEAFEKALQACVNVNEVQNIVNKYNGYYKE